MAPSLNPAEQALLDAVPVGGEIDYIDLHNNLQASRNKSSIRRYQDMRRAGTIQVRQAKDENGVLHSFVSRPGYLHPEGAKG